MSEVVLVDKDDNVVGQMEKFQAHLGVGHLHRAFSVFVVNNKGQILLQQRAQAKMLWHGYWSNSCCSHPTPGEAVEVAGARRLKEELGLTAACEALYAFEYHELFEGVGAEHEFCHVLLSRCDETPVLNPDEVSAFRWYDPATLTVELERNPEIFTPWFRMEWAHLSKNFAYLFGEPATSSA